MVQGTHLNVGSGMSNRLHCIAQKHDGYWSARCLDFTLYAIGDTLEEAKSKLIAEVQDYLLNSDSAPTRREADASERNLFYGRHKGIYSYSCGNA
jgi:hypothetical protein